LQLSWAWNEVAVIERLFPGVEEFEAYKQALRQITCDSNGMLLQVVEDLSYVYSDNREIVWAPEAIEEARTRYLRDLLRERNLFVSLNQGTLLQALGRNLAEEPKELVEV
jgi:hypothetical protein